MNARKMVSSSAAQLRTLAKMPSTDTTPIGVAVIAYLAACVAAGVVEADLQWMVQRDFALTDDELGRLNRMAAFGRMELFSRVNKSEAPAREESTTVVLPGSPELGQKVAVRFNGSTYHGIVTALLGKSTTGANAGRTRIEVDVVTGGRTRTLSRYYFGTEVDVKHGHRRSSLDDSRMMEPNGAYLLARGGK